MANEHWPGGLPPREWAKLAREFEDPDAWVQENVPPELQDWVYHYLNRPPLGPDDWV